MKRVLILICAFLLALSATYAQVPQNFNYQSIARKSNGQPLTSSNIGLRISIRNLTSTGTVVYRETHAASTNGFGLFTIAIGSGTVVSGNFAAIDWSTGAKFIEVEADFNGGTSYASMGTSQLLSVPYALYSQNGTPGPAGPQGPTGPQGATGPAGANGTAGTNGLGILNGPNDPNGSTGVDGEFYINTTSNKLFGPKAGGAWPSGIFLVGPAGPAGNDGVQGTQGTQGLQGIQGLPGTSGTNGLSLLNGTGDPINATGSNGEFYINTSTNTLFGPKTAGVWPMGVSLVGPQGPAGSVPDGAVAGNTTYWDGSTWVDSDNIFNDGSLVGIGTNSPAAKLDVVGTVKITDGTEGAGKILVSDASGLATWSPPGLLSPCYQCEVTYTSCISAAGGDADTEALCYDQYLTCRISCDEIGLQKGIKIEAVPRNSVFGYNASIGGSATNATAIGWGAGTSTSNTIQLGNSDVTQVLAGTGNATLVTGGLKVTGGTPGNGKVLTSDGGGLAAWADPVGPCAQCEDDYENLLIGAAGDPDGEAFAYDVYLNCRSNCDGVALQKGVGIVAQEKNSLFGYGATLVGSLVNATAIGGLATVNTSNTIQLGNSSVTKVLAGVGTNATLISGGLKITGGSPGVGKVLTSDANGVATWQTTGGGGWGLTGSTGTVDGTNFIGTTDNVPFSIRVNNQKAAKIDPAGPVFLGYQAGNVNMGLENTGVGYQALLANTTGDYNVAVGREALSLSTTGNVNSANGYRSLRANTTGSYNSASGGLALWNNTTGNENTAVGFQALAESKAGSRGTSIGANSMRYYNDTSTPFNNLNVAVGYESLRGSTSASSNTGNLNTAVGYQTMMNNTSGGENSAFGYQALMTASTGTQNTAVGNSALRMATGSINTAVGYFALSALAGGGDNTAIGAQSMQTMSSGSWNTAIGKNSLRLNSGGNYNTAIGFETLLSNSTGSNNTAIGASANVASGALTNATAIGNGAIVNASNAIQLGNSAVTQVNVGTGTTATLVAGGLQITGGSPAAGKVLTSDAAGIATWQAAGGGGGWGLTGSAGTIDGTNFIGTTDNVPFNIKVNNQKAGRIDPPTIGNSFYGYQAGNSVTTGGSNVGMGREALFSNTLGNGNTAIGAYALRENIQGGPNVAIGQYALTSNLYGSLNAALGANALFNNVGGHRATAIGAQAMMNANNSPGQYILESVAVGYEALKGSGTPSANTGNNNTSVGYQSMLNNTSGSYNTANGWSALYSNSTGTNNTASGFGSLYSNTTGQKNASHGQNALFTNSTGSFNTASGSNALYSNTVGDNNTAVGEEALYSNTTGTNNTALGFQASVGSSNLNNATAIGSGATVNTSNSIQLGNTSVTEATLGNGNNSILKVGEVRVGSSGEFNYSVAKARNLTIGNAAFHAAGPSGMTASRDITHSPGIPTSVYTANGPSPGVSAFTAQVNLPDGAIVTGLTAYVFDSNATYDLNVILTRQALGTQTIDNLAIVSSTGAPSSASYTTSSISNGTIDNSGYSYQVVFQSLANGNHALYNVKVTYTVGRAD